MYQPIQRLPATIVEKRQLNETYYWLKLELLQPVTYEVGQYLSLKVGSQFRAYSIASLPNGKYIELCIDTAPGGLGSQYIAAVTLGTTSEVLIPLGKFLLANEDAPSLFIATGAGIAPFKPMIEQLLTVVKTTQPIFLYWGIGYEKTVFWEDMWQRWTRECPNFAYTICLSREDVCDLTAHCRFKGRVTAFLETQTHFSDCQAYLCGSSEMIQQTKTLLQTKGMPESAIHFERYS